VSGARFTYLVHTYREPAQIYRLVRRLRTSSPDAQIMVSHDRKSTPLDDRRLAAMDAVWWPTSTDISWGDGSYLRSILAAYARIAPGPEDWVTSLSGQDYILRPLTDFEGHLSSSESDALLERTPDDAAEWNLRRRYLRRAYRVPSFAARGATGRLINLVPGLEWAVMPHGLRPMIERRVLRPPYPLTAIRRGNDFFAVNGKAAQRLLDAPARVVRHFERATHPAEGYPHTVLLNDPSIVVQPEMLHFARWRASSHPDYLTVDDLPEMLASGRWFARKFLPDAPVLDRLDNLLDRGRGAAGTTP
jgi:hypothetical protein